MIFLLIVQGYPTPKSFLKIWWGGGGGSVSSLGVDKDKLASCCTWRDDVSLVHKTERLCWFSFIALRYFWNTVSWHDNRMFYGNRLYRVHCVKCPWVVLMADSSTAVLTHGHPKISSAIIVWTYNDFGNNFEIKRRFTKYLNEIRSSGSDLDFSLRYLRKKTRDMRILQKYLNILGCSWHEWVKCQQHG